MKRDTIIHGSDSAQVIPSVLDDASDFVTTREISDARAALFSPDPLGDFVTNFKAQALPAKADKGESTTISASGDAKWRKCMAKNFKGRGEMSALLYRALEFYFDASGATVEPDGTIKSKQLSLAV